MAPEKLALSRISQDRGKDGTEFPLCGQACGFRLRWGLGPRGAGVEHLLAIAIEHSRARSADGVQGLVRSEGAADILFSNVFLDRRRILEADGIAYGEEVRELMHGFGRVIDSLGHHAALGI